MRIVECVRKVDAMKPNAFTDRMKMDWLNELEGRIYTEILLTAHFEFIPIEWAEDWRYVAPAAGLAAGNYYFQLKHTDNGIENTDTISFTIANGAALTEGQYVKWDAETLTTRDTDDTVLATLTTGTSTSGTKLKFSDCSQELFVMPPYDVVYPNWLAAKIDWYNDEFNRYANTAAQFEESLAAFERYISYAYAPANHTPYNRR